MKKANYCSLKWEGSTDVEDESGIATFKIDDCYETAREQYRQGLYKVRGQQLSTNNDWTYLFARAIEKEIWK